MPYGLPESTIVNKIVPKKKFTDNLGANTKIKERFTRDIENIRWLAKLAPSTLNINDGKNIHEIAVFYVYLKDENCPNDVFVFIDNMMPRYTLYILEYENKACLHINYKEKLIGHSDKRYHIIKTYRSKWMDLDQIKLDIASQSMDGIYDSLVRQIADNKIISNDRNLRNAVEETEVINVLQKEIDALERKLKKECQPKKKFVLHQQLVKLKAEIDNKKKHITHK